MTENLSHYITRTIKHYYKSRLLAPIVYLGVLAVVCIVFPVSSMLFPKTYPGDTDLEQLAYRKENYVQAKLKNLYFTGYTKKWLGYTEGYYYYTMMGDKCAIILLSPESSQQGLPTIDAIQVRGKILHNPAAMDKLLGKLAEDLAWSPEGMRHTISGYMLSEPDATNLPTLLLSALLLGTGAYALLSIAVYLLFIWRPVLSAPCQRLRIYGSPKLILNQAEEELATLPQLATEDMFITEHYFIELSNYGVAIVPIDQIIWIYKYSTLHKFLWHHFSISYTLHITAGKRQYIHCPKNIKSDIDGIIDYLSEANHNILVGFSEENRLKVEEIQGDFRLLQKFWSFLSKRV